jgi:hypothetical protein
MSRVEVSTGSGSDRVSDNFRYRLRKALWTASWLCHADARQVYDLPAGHL